jgi:hypothetical protein
MAIKILNDDKVQDRFYDALVGISNSFALSQLWVVGIDSKDIQKIQLYSEHSANKFEKFTPDDDNNVMRASFNFNKGWMVGDTYCLLARGAVFPGDAFNVERVGVNNSGALKGLVGTGRADLQNVTLTFLETNMSVADTFFRPWMIHVGFKSLKDDRLKIPIKLVCFQKAGVNQPLKVRKILTLEQSVPINIDSEEFNYSDGKIINRQIQFAFNRYQIESHPELTEVPSVASAFKYLCKNLEDSKGRYGCGDIRGIGFIDRARELFDLIHRGKIGISSRIEDIRDVSTRIMRNVGLDDQANKADEVFNDAKKNIDDPINDALTKGDRVLDSAEQFAALTTPERIGVGAGILASVVLNATDRPNDDVRNPELRGEVPTSPGTNIAGAPGASRSATPLIVEPATDTLPTIDIVNSLGASEISPDANLVSSATDNPITNPDIRANGDQDIILTVEEDSSIADSELITPKLIDSTDQDIQIFDSEDFNSVDIEDPAQRSVIQAVIVKPPADRVMLVPLLK